VNERPVKLWDGVRSPLANPGQIDLVVVRENAEGEYTNIGGPLYQEQEDELAIQTSVYTRRGIERVVRYAFELARTRRQHVTSISKANALPFGMVLWDKVFAEVAAEYADVETRRLNVDAAAMYLINKPSTLDVVVCANLFGDILSDEAAALAGGIGLAPGGNVNPERRYPSMFEPIHGSAPDIAGQGIANPLAAILAGAMLLRHLNATHAAGAIETAVGTLLREGRIRTPDLGGSASTAQVGDAICALVTEKQLVEVR
jgi:tartrate dehydrogenase/decarboxylase/D-malate dehydrogenase